MTNKNIKKGIPVKGVPVKGGKAAMALMLAKRLQLQGQAGNSVVPSGQSGPTQQGSTMC